MKEEKEVMEALVEVMKVVGMKEEKEVVEVMKVVEMKEER